METIPGLQDSIDALIHDLNSLMEQYEEAIRKDKYFEVKDELLEKIRLLQNQIAQVKEKSKSSKKKVAD